LLPAITKRGNLCISPVTSCRAPSRVGMSCLAAALP
jgi:hypothetical protein